MSAFSEARRLFLKRGAGAAVAAPIAMSIATQNVKAQAIGSALGGFPLPPMGSPAQGSGGYDPIAEAAHMLTRRTWLPKLRLAERTNNLNLAYRIGHFEPDIHGLRSVSLAHKAVMQRRRDADRMDLLQTIRKKLGWLDD